MKTTPALALLLAGAAILNAGEPVPDKLVVLTFDDSVKSQFTVVRPLLKKYGFGATFFITEGFDFPTNKRDYMTWEEIAQLHKDGFEIGNHTRDHLGVTAKNVTRLAEQLEAINLQCLKHGIPKTTSFAWPGNKTDGAALAVLQKAGIRFARRGGAPEYPYEQGRGFAYEPYLDHPLLIPSAGDGRPTWELDDFKAAVSQATAGRIAVLQFHGVPDKAHPWVNTPRDRFESFMRYLALKKFQVIALRDLAKYVDHRVLPNDREMIIRDRKQSLADRVSRDNGRAARDDDLRYWLRNMVAYHGYSSSEAAAALGRGQLEVERDLKRFELKRPAGDRVFRGPGGGLMVLPYPGGRHPRIGFLDGAIRPQRETKFSVFAPWKGGGYVVADIPEAIWHNTPKGRKLLYLAHTHVPTIWSERKIELKKLEWRRLDGGGLEIERRFPNGVKVGAKIAPGADGVRMQMWLTNGSKEKLSGLLVQNCVMLKGAPDFNARLNANDNKRLHNPYVACRNGAGDRWVITAWTQCKRPWGNVNCPCMHSDPQFPDCEPGDTQRLYGWLSFYEGQDIDAELKRIDSLGWRAD